MIDILVVGSINIDLAVAVAKLPLPGETVTGGRFWRAQGGKGANQAVAAARFVASVAIIGAVGDDDLGESAITDLEAEGVNASRVIRVPGQATGVALVVVDDTGENLIAVAPGANTDVAAPDVRRAVDDLRPRVILANLEVRDEVVIAAASAATPTTIFILNPAPFRPIPSEVLAAVSVLTPNEHEAQALLGGTPEGPGVPRLATDAGLSRAHLVVTLGARGALRVTGPEIIRYRAAKVHAVDTTGAGDAFNGVLAASLSAGDSIDRAIESAVAAATLSTLAAGARSKVPSKVAVEELIRSSARLT